MAYTTIDKPQEHFSMKVYSGNNTGEFKSTDFQLDWLWIKCRNNARSHLMYDTSRGFGNDKHVVPNTAVAQDGDVDGGQVSSGERGFIGSLGSGTTGFRTSSAPSGMLLVNGTGNTYVAWYWKANGGTTTAFSESGNNPAGTHQANTTAGFSIVTHVGTGAVGTIAHGLNAAPEWVLTKGLDDGHAWITSHKSKGFTKNTLWNTSDAFADDSTYNNTDPTSSVFTVKNQGGVNSDGENYVNYLFHSVQGFSKFGSYTGNGSTDGPFIYLGFKPAWVMMRNADDAANWNIYDNERSTENVMDDILLSNGADAEGAVGGKAIDFLSNGFKIRGSDNEMNDSGDTHVYMAFAESPFVSSEGVPTTAR